MFNIEKFRSADFRDRTEKVPVPELKDFFEPDETELFWTIRGLDGHEVAVTNLAVAQNKAIGKLVDGILSGKLSEKIDAIKESMGLSGKTPDDLARRIKMLELGSVDPKISESDSVLFAKVYPETFFSLTNKILILTGKGKKLGE